jgi:hypothetical protein
MSVEMARAFFGWCAVIKYGVLLWWFLVFVSAHDWIRVHGRWFRLPAEHFDAIHYGGMAIYKLGIFLFCLAPFLALLIIAQGYDRVAIAGSTHKQETQM